MSKESRFENRQMDEAYVDYAGESVVDLVEVCSQESALPPEVESHYWGELQVAMEQDQPHLNSQLRIADLAADDSLVIDPEASGEPRIGIGLALDGTPPQLVLRLEGRGAAPALASFAGFFDHFADEGADGAVDPDTEPGEEDER